MSEYYVDPLNGNDTTGDGLSDATAWKTTQKALDTIVAASGGDRINIKDSATDTLSAALDIDGVGKYGNPTSEANVLRFQGYTSSAGDGGIGVLDGGGTVGIINDNVVDAVALIDLKLGNCGANTVIDLDNFCVMINCEVHTSTLHGARFDSHATVSNCHIHNVSGTGIGVFGGVVIGCFFENGTNVFGQAIDVESTGPTSIYGNIVDIDGASNGIRYNDRTAVVNNTVYSAAGTGIGIKSKGATKEIFALFNNYVEGFSGVGGIGIQLPADNRIALYGHNKTFDNATEFDILGKVFVDLGNNTTLGASPLTNAAGNDFSVSTALKALGWPSSYKGASTNQYIDVGAAQRQEPAGGGGGGMLVHPGMVGGMHG